MKTHMNKRAYLCRPATECVVALVLMAATVPSAFGIAITTADGTGGDATIKESAPDTNYDRDFLEVRHNKYWSRKAYLRWDTSVLNSTSVTNASMSVMAALVQAVPVDMDVYGLNDGNAGESWSESTITWNNAPGNDTSGNDLLFGQVTFLGTLTAPIGTVEGDILSFSSPDLANFINADTDGQVTLILVNNSFANIQDDYSVQLMRKENTDTYSGTGLSYAPTLDLDLDLILGDFNGDNDVNIIDYNIMKAHWLSTGNPLNQNGEVTGDGVVDIADFLEFRENLFSGSASLLSNAIPEPGAGTAGGGDSRRHAVSSAWRNRRLIPSATVGHSLKMRGVVDAIRFGPIL